MDLNENNNESRETIINPEYNYSNIIANKDYIKILVQACDEIYKRLFNLFDENELKNERLKPEYKRYEYKKDFETDFDINVREKGIGEGSIGQTLHFDNYQTFSSYIDQRKDIEYLIIELNLTFGRNNEEVIVKHLNSFKITFEPYNVIFRRKSNYNDEFVNRAEMYIKSILDRFNTQDTIFYNKEK